MKTDEPLLIQSLQPQVDEIIERIGGPASRSVLAFCLAFLIKNHPELIPLIVTWPKIPNEVRLGILATVKALTEETRSRE